MEIATKPLLSLAIRVLLLAMLNGGMANAQQFERREVTIASEGLKLAAWYYTPTNLKPDEKRAAIVMAHGFSGVKEMYLDNFARKFAQAGFVVVVFDYRYFAGSEGEPRGQLLWPEQIQDYRNAMLRVRSSPKRGKSNRTGRTTGRSPCYARWNQRSTAHSVTRRAARPR